MFFHAAQNIMNRIGWKVGMAAREDHHFCDHFGTPFTIIGMVWGMLVDRNLLPEKSEPKHLLWTLYF